MKPHSTFRPVACLLLCVASLSISLRYAAGDDDALRAATVSVLGIEDGATMARSTGITIYVAKGFAYILTANSAVSEAAVEFDPLENSMSATTGKMFEKIQVRTPGAVVTADIVARDTANNLAVIRIPAPTETTILSPFKKLPELRRSGGVRICGPSSATRFGIEKSTLSSLRKHNGALELVQLGGSLSDAWTGAAVVDEEGMLVGIIVGGLEKRDISFAVPVSRLLGLLRGGVTGLAAESTTVSKTAARIDARLEVFDPFKRVDTITLVLEIGGTPKRVPFKSDGMVASASVELTGAAGRSVNRRFHAEFTLAGKVRKTEDSSVFVSFGAAPTSDPSSAGWLKAVAKAPLITSPPAPRPVVSGRHHPEIASLRKKLKAGGIRDGIKAAVNRFYGFVLEGGFLSQIELKDGLENRRLPLGFAVYRIGMTSQGLAIYSHEIDQLWLIDPSSLEVKSRIGITFSQKLPIIFDWQSKMVIGQTPFGSDQQSIHLDPLTGSYEIGG